MDWLLIGVTINVAAIAWACGFFMGRLRGWRKGKEIGNVTGAVETELKHIRRARQFCYDEERFWDEIIQCKPYYVE